MTFVLSYTRITRIFNFHTIQIIYRDRTSCHWYIHGEVNCNSVILLHNNSI